VTRGGHEKTPAMFRAGVDSGGVLIHRGGRVVLHFRGFFFTIGANIPAVE
jgi:hypothetical protein